MNAQPRVYRFSAANSWAQTIMGLVLVLVFGAGAWALWRLFGGGPDPESTKYIPACSMAFFACLGLGLAVTGIQAISDRSAKLTINQDELIDHRAKGGEVRLRWADVASVDCELWGAGGKLVVYVRDLAEIRTREVDLSGLDQCAEDIFVEIKKHLLMHTTSDLPLKKIEIVQDLNITEIALPRSRPDKTG